MIKWSIIHKTYHTNAFCWYAIWFHQLLWTKQDIRWQLHISQSTLGKNHLQCLSQSITTRRTERSFIQVLKKYLLTNTIKMQNSTSVLLRWTTHSVCGKEKRWDVLQKYLSPIGTGKPTPSTDKFISSRKVLPTLTEARQVFEPLSKCQRFSF